MSRSFLVYLNRISVILFCWLCLSVQAYARSSVPDNFITLAARLSPAVVNISTAQSVDLEQDIRAFPKDSPLERFNDFFGGSKEGRSISKSLGSGFVIDPQGYIVTNNHVIENADIIEVTFPDGATYKAQILGRDPVTDIALLKIGGRDRFPHVNFARGDDTAQVGEWVMAIGNPFGYGGSVSAGIISARNRSLDHSSYDDFIQTDVAINKGNSGGPLFNMAGDVVGVNTAILSPTGYSVGISFSVPADLAQSVIQQLRQYGETRRGRLGVRVNRISPEIAEQMNLEETSGAIITYVEAGSPALRAGLRRNDVILSVAGIRIQNERRLFRLIAEAPIGHMLEISYIRKGKTRRTQALIERLAEEVTKAGLTADIAHKGESEIMGIAVEALTSEVRRRYQIRPDIQGVRVVNVGINSPAAGKLTRGDIIEEINFITISSPQQFSEVIQTLQTQKESLIVLVNQRGNYKFYSLAVKT